MFFFFKFDLWRNCLAGCGYSTSISGDFKAHLRVHNRYWGKTVPVEIAAVCGSNSAKRLGIRKNKPAVVMDVPVSRLRPVGETASLTTAPVPTLCETIRHAPNPCLNNSPTTRCSFSLVHPTETRPGQLPTN